jgi:hypothetical protein
MNSGRLQSRTPRLARRSYFIRGPWTEMTLTTSLLLCDVTCLQETRWWEPFFSTGASWFQGQAACFR